VCALAAMRAPPRRCWQKQVCSCSLCCYIMSGFVGCTRHLGWDWVSTCWLVRHQSHEPSHVLGLGLSEPLYGVLIGYGLT